MMNRLLKVGILGVASVFYVKNKQVKETNQRPVSRSHDQPLPIRSPLLIQAEELQQPAVTKSKECILGESRRWPLLGQFTSCEKKYWPFIGQQRSNDLNSGLSLVNTGNVTCFLASDWSIQVM